MLYPRYLVMAHTITRGSVPLMEAARDAADRRAAVDPVSAQLVTYLDKHIPEEMGHDDWLLDDLEFLGVSRDEAMSHPPSPAVAAFVGSQYYYVLHSQPVALLGYLAMLEGHPPTDELCQSAAQLSGYPLEAFRTLRKHANLDPHHSADLDTVLDAMPLTRDQLNLITTNAMATKDRAGRLMNELVDEHPMTLLERDRTSG
ncbi:iron-containing redox enzyme family protein [Micromonospora sp. MS34]|uniref:iron-containing redox enzyme family protein n=1 Tax=Micromonospora sp. MS34 TaxID=3385971 RepID=UPI0039A12719